MKKALLLTLLTLFASAQLSQAKPHALKNQNSSKYNCAKKTCSQMSSCAEAEYKFNHCGHKKLDRDRDGIPCEKICG